MNDFIVCINSQDLRNEELVVRVDDAIDAISRAIKQERERCLAICMKEVYNGVSNFTDEQRRVAHYLARLIEKGE